MRCEEKRRRVKEQVESVSQWQRTCCLFLHFVCIRIVMHFDIRLRMARMEWKVMQMKQEVLEYPLLTNALRRVPHGTR